MAPIGIPPQAVTMYFVDVEIIVAAKHRVLGDDAAGCVSAVGDAGADI